MQLYQTNNFSLDQSDTSFVRVVVINRKQRPVKGIAVSVSGKTTQTDENGIASFELPVSSGSSVTASVDLPEGRETRTVITEDSPVSNVNLFQTMELAEPLLTGLEISAIGIGIAFIVAGSLVKDRTFSTILDGIGGGALSSSVFLALTRRL